MTGGKADNVAFIQNTSHGMSLIANGHPWQTGDNVLVPALDFPSNFLPWKRLEKVGVEFRTIEAPDGRMTVEAVQGAIDDRTRIVALSGVQYYNGYRPDLAAIADLVHNKGAFLVVDGSQGAGAFHFDIQKHGIDALVVSSHKWMLGPLGIGFMALSDRLLEVTEPTEIGWLSVREPFDFRRELDYLDNAEKFEPGTENAAGLYGLHERIREIEEYGLAEISESILALNASLIDQLKGLGCEVSSDWEGENRSGILTFCHPGLDSEAVVLALQEQNIWTSARQGYVRVSPHYYNSEDEMAELLDQVQAMIRGGAEAS